MSQFATVYTASYPRDLYAGVRTRRLFAWMLDALIVAFLTLLERFPKVLAELQAEQRRAAAIRQ